MTRMPMYFLSMDRRGLNLTPEIQAFMKPLGSIAGTDGKRLCSFYFGLGENGRHYYVARHDEIGETVAALLRGQPAWGDVRIQRATDEAIPEPMKSGYAEIAKIVADYAEETKLPLAFRMFG